MHRVCHGAPSKSVYSKYIREKSGNEPVAKMDFREKATWGWGTAISLYMKNGNEYKSDCYNDPYLKAFSSGLIVRDSCSSCAYTQTSRVGDFTIGDFWGVKQIDEQYSDGKGTSLVFVNSKKAHSLFKLIQKNATLVKKVSLERVVEISSSNNGQILRPVKKNPAKQKFFNEYARDDVSFDIAYARAHKEAYEKNFEVWNLIGNTSATEKMGAWSVPTEFKQFATWEEHLDYIANYLEESLDYLITYYPAPSAEYRQTQYGH